MNDYSYANAKCCFNNQYKNTLCMYSIYFVSMTPGWLGSYGEILTLKHPQPPHEVRNESEERLGGCCCLDNSIVWLRQVVG